MAFWLKQAHDWIINEGPNKQHDQNKLIIHFIKVNDEFTLIVGPTINQTKTTIILNYSCTPKHLNRF